MKKMQTIFLRDMRLACTPVTGDVNPLCRWVFDGQGVATRKIDGINVKIEKGVAYQRVKPATADYKEAEYEPVTDEFVLRAIASRPSWNDGIYEAYGEGIRGNKEKVKGQHMVSIVPLDHALVLKDAPRTYRELMGYFATRDIEGIVFHRDDIGDEMAKIKTKDFYHLDRP